METINQLRVPSAATLKKYGLSVEQWNAIADAQGRVCFVCHQVPKSGILHIDHDHQKGWKKKPPEERRLAVRGLLCFRCNTTYVGRSITVERSENVTKYLKRFEAGEVSLVPTEAPAVATVSVAIEIQPEVPAVPVQEVTV